MLRGSWFGDGGIAESSTPRQAMGNQYAVVHDPRRNLYQVTVLREMERLPGVGAPVRVFERHSQFVLERLHLEQRLVRIARRSLTLERDGEGSGYTREATLVHQIERSSQTVFIFLENPTAHHRALIGKPYFEL